MLDVTVQSIIGKVVIEEERLSWGRQCQIPIFSNKLLGNHMRIITSIQNLFLFRCYSVQRLQTR